MAVDVRCWMRRKKDGEEEVMFVLTASDLIIDICHQPLRGEKKCHHRTSRLNAITLCLV